MADKYHSEDITFCVSPCSRKSCYRHKSNIQDPCREHTVADAVSVCAEIVPVFEAKGVPVIRIGLNPSEELSGGAAAAGAYHPALGELVRSEILRRRASALLRDIPAGAAVTLGVAPSQVSAMTGQHRKNIGLLKAELGLSGVRVRGVPGAGKDEILIVDWKQE